MRMPLELQVGLVDLFFFREQPAFTTSQDRFEQEQRCRLFFEGASGQADVFAKSTPKFGQ
jgi:hypothetical protein